jgi:HK97 gp10 family phage protein
MPRNAVSIRVQADARLRRNLERLAGDQRRQAQRNGIEAGLRVIETNVKTSMTGDKGGVVYGRHQASAPGEAPAIDTGNLFNSFELGDVTPTLGSLGTNAEYAEPLEYGTSRMEPRPFLRPAVDEHEGEILDAVSRTIEEFVGSL